MNYKLVYICSPPPLARKLHACPSTYSPIQAMSPVCSATAINSSGNTIPSSGSFNLANASAEWIFPVLLLYMG